MRGRKSRARGWAVFFGVLGMAGDIQAQDRMQDGWTAPIGGTWSAKLAVVSEYSYRGISQTDRQPGVQAIVGYTLPIVQDTLNLYLEGWGASTRVAPQTSTELTASGSLVFTGLDRKLSVWLTFSRYNYLDAPPELRFNYNEFLLWTGYDFGPFALGFNLGYSPNYYADSGTAWYKEVVAVVPLKFLDFDERIAFKLFATLGNQYIERPASNGLANESYWDWEIGLRMRFETLFVTLSYVDTNLDVAGCSDSRNCEGRFIVKMSKTF